MNKLGLKVMVEELDEKSQPTGKQMILKSDLSTVDINNLMSTHKIGFMISHWINSFQQLMNNKSSEQVFQGEPIPKVEIINQLKTLTRKLESGTYKASEFMSITDINPDSSLHGNATLIFNVKQGNKHG